MAIGQQQQLGLRAKVEPDVSRRDKRKLTSDIEDAISDAEKSVGGGLGGDFKSRTTPGGGGGGGGMGGGTALAAGAGAKRAGLLSSMGGGAAAAASTLGTVFLGGTVAVGMLKALEKTSGRLKAANSMFGTALNLAFKPLGDFIGRMLEPWAKASLEAMVALNQNIGEDGLIVGGVKSLVSLFTNWPSAIADIYTKSLDNALGGLFGGDRMASVNDFLSSFLPGEVTVAELVSWLLPPISVYRVLNFVFSNIPSVDDILGLFPSVNATNVLTTVFSDSPSASQIVSIFPGIGSSQVIDAISWPGYMPAGQLLSQISWPDVSPGSIVNMIGWPDLGDAKDAIVGALTGTGGGGGGGDDDGNGSIWDILKPQADGGVVTGPTPSLIGEAGPEAVIPLDRLGDVLANQGQGGQTTQQSQRTTSDRSSQRIVSLLERIERQIAGGEQTIRLQTDKRRLGETTRSEDAMHLDSIATR